MKKFVVLFVAVMLALPVMSYAGSATSRWDLTIGGMVKVDVAYVDQAINQDLTNAERQAGPGNTSSRDKWGNLGWGAGETRLNFLVKGPDTWGAKTSAFVEFDFRSMTSNAISAAARNNVEDYGLANLRHAFMKFDWPTFSLVMGRTWQVPGVQPCFCLLGVNEIGPFNKGGLPIQIYGTWQATKQFSVTAGVMSPSPENSWPNGTIANGIAADDGMNRIGKALPLFFTELAYKTDACGKIGPWMLQFAVGGAYGRENPIAPATLGPDGDINSAAATNTVSAGTGVQYWNQAGYANDTVDVWLATFRTYIPIIPEKAPGKLAGSLGFAATGFTGQDIRRFAGAPGYQLTAYSYNRADYSGTAGANTVAHPVADHHAPTGSGGWGQLTFYFTDTVWTGFYYGTVQYNLSQNRKNVISPGSVERQDQYTVNLVYDPNPAIRLGLEYTYIMTHFSRNLYAQSSGSLTSQGSVNMIRFGAQYFF